MDTPNLKRGGKREREQNHMLSERKSKWKPTRLSNEGVENNIYEKQYTST